MDVTELVDAFKDQSSQATANHAQHIQRVQELMGQGFDVSSLFPTMVSSASTRDITVKKAAYAFLSKYGHLNEELCFLSINTLHQDCADLDPIVRSLALRTLCSLGQKSVLRFMLQPLNKGLQDKNAHVRKTAAMACISLFELDSAFVLESEIVDLLYGLLRDKDTQVVVNAILALETILVDEGGIVINHNIVSHLIRRYKDWNSNQLQIILGVLCRYKPRTDDEIYEVMHSSPAVHLATIRLFIWLCQDLPEIQDELQCTIQETLIKHLESSIPDLVHASLSHLALIIHCTGKLYLNSQQHLQATFCSANDPVVIKLQKLSVCVRIAQSSDPTTTLFILDNLCTVASMSHLTTLHKTSRTKLERHTITSHLEVTCRAIEAIGQIGSQCQLQDQPSPSQQKPTQADVLKTCHGRLFQLLVLFSDTEHVYDEHNGRKGDQRKSKGMPVDWKHAEIAELELEDAQVSRVLSTLLIAIEGCWQRKMNARKRGEEPIVDGGVFEALQIKVLGLLLLRHLDQEELDRRAKKKKPLRYRYEHEDSPASSTVMESSLLLQQEHPGDISRQARISGIRMLLLEESFQQLVLRKQLLDSSDALIDSDSPETEKRCQNIKAALEMRTQYALLLQQQVQDLVQSIDQSYTTTSTTVAAPSDRLLLRARNEQLTTLHLACHLVAFSIEHEDAHRPDQTLLRQRLDILAQAVGQLIPDQSPTGSPLGDSLITFDNGDSRKRREDHQNNPNAVGRVSRDVIDRAQLIESMFLAPLSDMVGTPETSHQNSTSHNSPFDSPLFKTEKYRQLVKQKFAAQFGIKGRNNTTNVDKNYRDATLVNNIDMSSLLHQDWLLQVGFNTLTALR
ncbi:AP-4 complex subunit beta-1 [Haplosporangium sp. Z 11]|nr:AP-4 complex subunit beta-1 [Haplosporangium sp. Z 11]